MTVYYNPSKNVIIVFKKYPYGGGRLIFATRHFAEVSFTAIKQKGPEALGYYKVGRLG